ncbi:MAG: hypothetical protein GX075_12950 [Firmicutes bacterium]|nr:hypothetical protein [Bacillota bacterium]
MMKFYPKAYRMALIICLLPIITFFTTINSSLAEAQDHNIPLEIQTKYFRVIYEPEYLNTVQLIAPYLDQVYEYVRGYFPGDLSYLPYTVSFKDEGRSGGRHDFINKTIIISSSGPQFPLISHELTHAFTADLWRSCPRWISEGHAEYVKDARYGLCRYALELSGELVQPSLPAIGPLVKPVKRWSHLAEKMGGRGKEPSHYAGPESIFVYISQKYGREKLIQWTTEVYQSCNINEACKRVLGKSQRKVEADWHQWINSSEFGAEKYYGLQISKPIWNAKIFPWTLGVTDQLRFPRKLLEKYNVIIVIWNRKDKLPTGLHENDFPGLKEVLAGEGATIKTEKVGSRWNIYLVGDDNHQICEVIMKFDYGKFESGIIKSLN